MSWIPQFLNWQTAAIAGAAAVPLLLVLYFLKLRRREFSVPSTLLWKKAVQDLQVNAPFQKLRKNLLLFLQLLLLLLLVLALARPVANLKRSAGKMTVLLIDNSASMGAKDMDNGKKTRLEDAKRRAKELVDSMKRDDVACLIVFNDSAQTVVPFTTDTALLRSSIDRVEQTDRATRLKLAYKMADAMTSFNGDQLRSNVLPDVFLYSDGRVLDADTLSLRGDLHYEREGNDNSTNVGIVALSAKRNYENPTEVEIFARLANFGPAPIEAEVALTIDGEYNTSKLTYLLPERWSDEEREKYESDPNNRRPADSATFKVNLQGASVIRVEQMQKLGDVLAADDFAEVVIPPPRTLSVLLVTDGNYYLERAMDSMNLKHPEKMPPNEYEDKAQAQKLSSFDVIIFDRYAPKHVPPTGNFIYFGAVPDGVALKAEKLPTGKNVLIEDTTVLDWKRDHPTLRHLTLNKLYIKESLKFDLPLGADVLVEGFKCPLVVHMRQNGSQYLFISFNLLESNWPLQLSFPIFIHNALQFMTTGADMDVRESYSPGATPIIPRPELQKLGEIPKTLKLTGPAGTQTVNVPATGDVVLPALDHVGTYTLDPPVSHYDRFAVNLLDENESNTMPAAPPGSIGEVDQVEGGQQRTELWRGLALGALAMLMVEWWVYTRRVHL